MRRAYASLVQPEAAFSENFSRRNRISIIMVDDAIVLCLCVGFFNADHKLELGIYIYKTSRLQSFLLENNGEKGNLILIGVFHAHLIIQSIGPTINF